MSDPFECARRLADSVRFGGEIHHAAGVTDVSTHVERLRSFFRHNELRITESVTPGLFAVLSEASRRLLLHPERVEAFVYESSEFQASCILQPGDRCLIRISSRCVDLLSPHELQFVVGHELGHHLLSHFQSPSPKESLEGQMAARASEISADRMGLIACGSLEVAIRALMKSVSGLPDRFLRFDVNQYLAQFTDSQLSSLSTPLTHPSMGVRCRALLWYASAQCALDGRMEQRERLAIDERVLRDLNHFIDASAQIEIQRRERDFAMWLAIAAITADGRFTRAEQAWLADKFGNDSTLSVVSMLKDLPPTEVQALVLQKRAAALEELKTAVPHSWQARVEGAQKFVRSKPD
jgi:hypothetical protein